MPKRYAIVGASSRSQMYIDALVDAHPDLGTLVSLCDVSPTRMTWHNSRIKEKFDADPVPQYDTTDFEKMLDEQKVDTVIVTTIDRMHHEYIVRAMEAGRDVICEKPMTIDAEKAKAIFDVIERTGRELRVTFNYRYAPLCTRVQELILEGVIGQPLAVEFRWMLNTAHGADYFRRWHANKANSGGLLVHKSTHHFDMVNWWIDSYPQTVYCLGDLKFYGKANAERRGERYDYDRYTGSGHEKTDPFAIDLAASEDSTNSFFLESEKDDGYIRDRNVFGDHIDIEDTISISARYRNGVILSYSMLAYSPWEGMRVAITGTKGRLEVADLHGYHIVTDGEDDKPKTDRERGVWQELRVYPMFQPAYDVEIPQAEGSHSGGDDVLVRHLLMTDPPPDPLNRAASHIDGAASILAGIAANESIRTGAPIAVDDLLKLPEKGSAAR